MKTEISNKRFLLFVLKAVIITSIILGFVIFLNYSVDASHVITSRTHDEMARLALEGNIVATPQNYNERVYQLAIVKNMLSMPDTIVIGCSRGMFLGHETTGFDGIYNNCVSGACLEDYYALLGLYYDKFSKLPSRVIIETSPWIFYEDNPEARWLENYTYMTSCEKLYYVINNKPLKTKAQKENPYLSIPYFQYNFSVLLEKGIGAFSGDPAHISTDISEAADYPDGSIRYAASLENASKERLAAVKSETGPVTYQNVNNMTEISDEKMQGYDALIRYLLDAGVEVLIYLQPFSVTLCHYIYDEGFNPIFGPVEKSLHNLAGKYGIKIIGSFDARKYRITDELFIDFVHLDKKGTSIVWESDYP